MVIEVNITIAKQLIKLLKQFEQKEYTTASDFAENMFYERCECELNRQITEQFLMIKRHDPFFHNVVDNFWTYFGLKHFNKHAITVLMHFVIFGLVTDNYADTSDTFRNINYRFAPQVAEYFTTEDNMVDITQAGCKIYENDYVLNNILHPLLDKCNLIKRLSEELDQDTISKHIVKPKPVTIPIPPNCYTAHKKTPRLPLNSPVLSKKQFKSSKMPTESYKSVIKLENELKLIRGANKKEAQKLLEFARNNAFHCAIAEPKKIAVEEPITSLFKARKLPLRKEVVIKSNAATLLREAAVLVKDQEKEIKKLETMSTGGFDPSIIEALEQDMYKYKEQERLQDIERKHLQGQLTHEEVKLAKNNLLRLNQEKMEQFKEERLDILKEIDEWRELEETKIRILVEKTQNIERAARDAERKLYEEKKYNARMLEIETKNLLEEAYREKERELERKVQLIQELRALEHMRTSYVKEFDPTESPNFGLLCEMSIAELQERLGLLKIEVQEEMDERRRVINENKLKQQQLLESVKNFITQTRMSKSKLMPRTPAKLEQTPDIIALREKLEQARSLNTATSL